MSKKKRKRIPQKAAVVSTPRTQRSASAVAEAPDRPLWVLPALAALAFVCYWNSLHGGLVFDDSRLIHFNFNLRDWNHWREIFLSERYRPLLVWTFAWNYRLSGINTVSYHLFNVLFHATAVVLFYLFLSRQSLSWQIPAAAAALMAVHPLNTESVSYISSRSTVLCSVFYFSSLLFLDSYIRNPKRFLWGAGYFVAFLLGATVKEEAAMIPIAALLYQYIFFGRETVRKNLSLNLLGGIVLAIGVAFRVSMQLQQGGVPPYSLSLWIPTEISVWLRYIGLAFWPAKLNIDPDIPAVSFSSPLFWISVVLIGAMIVYAWRVKRKNPFIAFWVIWYFLNLLPSSVFPLNDFMAEHRTYISTFGFAACTGYLLIKIPSTSFRAASICGLCLLIFFYSLATFHRNEVWSTPVRLWQDSVSKSPQKYRPHVNLATSYMKHVDYDLAIPEFQNALNINGNGAEAYSGLGICYLQKGNVNLAEMNFQKASLLDPALTDPKTGLGLIYHQQGRFQDAVLLLEQAYPQRQESVQIIDALADSYLHLQNRDRAIWYLRRGNYLNPRNPIWQERLRALGVSQ